MRKEAKFELFYRQFSFKCKKKIHMLKLIYQGIHFFPDQMEAKVHDCYVWLVFVSPSVLCPVHFVHLERIILR